MRAINRNEYELPGNNRFLLEQKLLSMKHALS